MWKWQPGGGLIGLGTSPVRITRLRPRMPDLGIGTADSERLGVGMQRHLEQALLVGHLDDAAEIHDGDAVADVLDHGEVVGDEQVGELELLLQVDQQVDDLRLDRDVERRHRLVADDQVGAERQRAGDADALALAAGEFVRVGEHGGGPQPHALEQVGDALAALGRRADIVDDQRLAHDLARRHARVQRGVGILVDHLHAPPVGQHALGVEAGDVLAADADGAAGRLQQFQERAADWVGIGFRLIAEILV